MGFFSRIDRFLFPRVYEHHEALKRSLEANNLMVAKGGRLTSEELEIIGQLVVGEITANDAAQQILNSPVQPKTRVTIEKIVV